MTDRNPDYAPSRCPECRGQVLELATLTDKIEARGRIREFEYDAYRCTACGEILLTADQADRWDAARVLAIRELKELMPPEAIRSIRRRYCVSQAALERILGVGPKTVARWEAGTVPHSKPVDKLLRIAERFPAVFADLAAEEGITVTRTGALEHVLINVESPLGSSRLFEPPGEAEADFDAQHIVIVMNTLLGACGVGRMAPLVWHSRGGAVFGESECAKWRSGDLTAAPTHA